MATEHDLILRCYGDEPKRMKGIIENKLLFVYRDNPSTTLGWPRRDVFKYDQETFQQIHDAWEDKQPEELRRAWALAVPFTW